MEKKFTYLSKSELNKLSIEDLVKYYKAEREYIINNDLEIRGREAKKIMHPFMYLGLLISHKLQKFEFEIHGCTPKTKRPIIYSTTHIGLLDIDATLHAIKKHAYIFADDEEYMYRTIDGLLFDLNGRIYIDNNDRNDRKIALETTKKMLKYGESILWFPERTWNISSNYVVLPMAFGMIEAAYESNALIVPIGLEQLDAIDKTKFIVNIGSPIDICDMNIDKLTKDKKIELIEMVRSNMASLKIDAWETMSRDQIDDGYYQRFVAKRISEWPFYTVEKINSMTLKFQNYFSEEDVFSHLANLELNQNNAFLAKSQREYIKTYKNQKQK